jgi:hypothetical protein
MSSIDEFSARGDVDAEFLGGTEDLVVRVAQSSLPCRLPKGLRR